MYLQPFPLRFYHVYYNVFTTDTANFFSYACLKRFITYTITIATVIKRPYCINCSRLFTPAIKRSLQAPIARHKLQHAPTIHFSYTPIIIIILLQSALLLQLIHQIVRSEDN